MRGGSTNLARLREISITRRRVKARGVAEACASRHIGMWPHMATSPSGGAPSDLDRQRQRAETAEILAHEEGAKSDALQKLVENLMDENIALQRKWEKAKHGAPVATPTKPPPLTTSTSRSVVGSLGNPPPTSSKARGQAPWSPPVDTCDGVLLLQFEALELTVGEDASLPALFVEFWLDEGLVRSHALVAGATRPTQSFALPVRRQEMLPPETSKLPLCATLCVSDGEGGGRPVAIAVITPHAPALAPFQPAPFRTELLPTPPGALPYSSPAGHTTSRAADAHGAWREAWSACLAARRPTNGRGGSAPLANDASRPSPPSNLQDLTHPTNNSTSPSPPPPASPPPPPSPTSLTAAAAAAAAEHNLMGHLALQIEWRPLPDGSGGVAGADGVSSASFDALGFPISSHYGDGGDEGIAAATPLRRAASHGASSFTPSRAFTPGATNGSSASDARTTSNRQHHARCAVGGWWETDALCLCRWNALICSCASIDAIPTSRLRTVLAGGVPFQHRLHVWTACCGGGARRADYHPSLDIANATARDLALYAASKAPPPSPMAFGVDGAEGAEDVTSLPLPLQVEPSPTQLAFGTATAIIDKDLLRTYPTHPFFDAADAPMIAPMRRVLIAFVAFHPEISYCQGLNFIAALLLLHGDEGTCLPLTYP